MDNTRLTKDKECIGCREILRCKGKPVGTEFCLNYKARESEGLDNGRTQNVHEENN